MDNNTLSHFDLDYSQGLEGEELVHKLLTQGLTVEVKKDFQWQKTNNIFIETSCLSTKDNEWHDSGLNVTQAKYWAFVLKETVIMVPTEVLKHAVAWRGRKINNYNSPNPSMGVLITVEDLLWVTREWSQ